MASIKVRVRPDLTGFISELRGKLQSIEDATNIRVGVDIDESRLSRAQSDLDHLADDRNTTINADLDAALARAQLAILTRPAYKSIIVGVEANSAFKTLKALSGIGSILNFGNSFKSIASNADKLALSLAAVLSVAMSLTSLSGVALGGLAISLSQLASLGNLAVLAPGGIAASVAAILALKAAVSTLAAEVGQDLSDAWGRANSAMGDAAWSRMEGEARSLAGTIDGLTTHLETLGAGAGEALNSLMASFNAGPLNQGLKDIADSTGAMLSAASSGVGAFADAIGSLMSFAAPHIEAFGAAITDAGVRFRGFVESGISSGSFDAGLKAASDTLSTLGSIASSTVGIFYGLGVAAQAAGGGGLNTLAGSLSALSGWINSVSGQVELLLFFEAANEASQSLASGLGNFFTGLGSQMSVFREGMRLSADAISVLLTALGSLVGGDAVGAGLLALFRGLNEAAPLFAEGITSLEPAIGAILASLGELLPVLGEIFSSLSALASEVIPVLAPILAEVGTIIGTALTEAFNALQPALSAFMDWVNSINEAHPGLIAGLTAVVAVVGLLGLAVMGAFAPITGIVLGVIAAIAYLALVWNGLVDLWNKGALVIELVKSYLTAFARDAVIALVTGFNNLKATVEGVFNGISTAVTSAITVITTTFNGVLSFLSTVPGTVWGYMTAFAQAVGNGAMNAANWLRERVSSAVNAVIGFFQNLVNNVTTAISGLASSVSNWASTMMQNLGSAVSSGIDTVVNLFTGLGDSITNTLSGLVDSMVSIGGNIVDGLARGISGALGAVTSAVQGIIDKIPGPIKSALGIHSPSRVMMGLGKWVSIGLGKGIDQNKSSVATAAEGLARTVASTTIPMVESSMAISEPTPLVAGSREANTAGATRQQTILRIGGREFSEMVLDATKGVPL